MTICTCDPGALGTAFHWVAKIPLLGVIVAGAMYIAPAAPTAPADQAPITVTAEPTPGPVVSWDNPASNPNTASRERSLQVLVEKGSMPANVAQAFNEQFAKGVQPEVRDIPDGATFRGMMFGDAEFMGNVRASTSVWPAHISKSADVYSHYDPETKRIWLLVRPHACNNYAVGTAALACDCAAAP